MILKLSCKHSTAQHSTAQHSTAQPTCRRVGEVQGEAGEVDVGIIVPTDGFNGLQTKGGSLGTHLAIQITGRSPLWEELFSSQLFKHLQRSAMGYQWVVCCYATQDVAPQKAHSEQVQQLLRQPPRILPSSSDFS